MPKKSKKEISKEVIYNMDLEDFTKYLSELTPKEREKNKNVHLFMLGCKTAEQQYEGLHEKYRILSYKYNQLIKAFSKINKEINNLEFEI